MLALAGVAAGTLTRPKPGDAEPYHARVRAAVDEIPRQIEGWVGVDAKVPEAAQKLLKPNAIRSRTYRDLDTGHAATFVIVHTKDARDMLGHYPPNCYPRSGWTLEDARRRTWEVHGVRLEGMEYRFSVTRPGEFSERVVVDNLLILPGGEFATDMDEVIDLASDYTRHFFGAGQIQLLTNAALSDERRDEIFQTILGANLPLIEALVSAQDAAEAP